jgi:hypothetical protein
MEHPPLHPANHHPATLKSGLSARSSPAHVPWQSRWRVRFDACPPKSKPQGPTTKKLGRFSTVQNERSKKRPVKFPPPTHPSTTLQKGNSDPFNAAAVPIDPRTHHVLLFYRDCLFQLCTLSRATALQQSKGCGAGRSLYLLCTRNAPRTPSWPGPHW